MRNIFLIALAAALTAPAVAADHWDDDTAPAYFGDSGCSMDDESTAMCKVEYACTGGKPPQIVDTVLYCAGRAKSESGDIAASLPYWAWSEADSETLALQSGLASLHGALQPTADEANEPLCNVVWSLFCTNPLTVPDDVPADDPVEQYPILQNA